MQFLVSLLALPFVVSAAVKFENLKHANRCKINANGKIFFVYSSESEKSNVLLTHHWRDLGAEFAGWVAAPAAERTHFEKTHEYWAGMVTKRFHYYTQQSTKILVEPVKVSRWVKDGDEIIWQDLKFKVLATPGFTRGAVTYIAKIDRKTIAFTGDLIYGDGKIFDLYSFQDAIPEAKVGGYHGYGARLADLITSLEKIKDWKPDIIYPARGPVINNPTKAIDKLISRVQALYQNYLSTNALHWYISLLNTSDADDE
mgnify:CR=1 FL=1